MKKSKKTLSPTRMSPQKFKAVLLDLSGTLYIDKTVINGAVAAVDRLRLAGKRVRFLTNTSKQSSQALLQQLVDFGFVNKSRDTDCDNDSQDDSLITSVLATRNYLLKHNLRPYCIMEDTSDFLSADIPLDPPHTAVVVGLAPTQCTYTSMNQAFQILLNQPQYPLIAIHKGKHYRDANDELSLGPGPFVAGLEIATDRVAVVMGKPSRAFFDSALFPSIDASETVMIGDDALQDIQGAVDAGIGTCILVKTGKYRLGDENKVQAKDSTVVVCDTVVEAVAYLLEDGEA
jgi:HAD superfamily hydrolase (TIGR01458 family)